MLELTKGNLLEADAEALVNAVNTWASPHVLDKKSAWLR